jgi:CRISPR-associated endonuclease/helicase Cas3
VHGAQVAAEAEAAARRAGLDYATLLHLAGRWHDAGKALAPFQHSIAGAGRPDRQDIAKAPSSAWLPPNQLYPDPPHPRRRGLRHELASTLALFAVLMRHRPDHPALLGPWKEWLQRIGRPLAMAPPAAEPPNALEQEILALDAEAFDLLAYLVCSHHGKVRMAWHAAPADQQAAEGGLRIRGIRDGETLPALTLATAQGEYLLLPPSELHLDAAAVGLNPRTGRGWTERVLDLLERHGPFALAYLEALLRAADWRASRSPMPDPFIAGNGVATLIATDPALTTAAHGDLA